jgi:hypothetical protein
LLAFFMLQGIPSMMRRKTVKSGVAFVLTALVMSGCSSGGPRKTGVDVKGRLSNKGTPMVAKTVNGQKVGRVQLWLIKEGMPPPATRHSAQVNDDGTFYFDEGDRPEPGKYQVCVKWQDDYPTGPDKLGGRFDEGKSKIVRTISATEPELVIDVSHPEG